MLITPAPPNRLTGKLKPEGALTKKSSPGYGGPLSGPLNGAALSAPDAELNVPVLIGVPSTTAQPS